MFAITNAHTIIGDEKYSAVTDSKGDYDIARLAADTYNLIIQKEGYVVPAQLVIIKPGVINKLEF